MKKLLIISLCFLFFIASAQQKNRKVKHVKTIRKTLIANKDSSVFQLSSKDTIYHIVKWQVVNGDSIRVHTFSHKKPKGIK